MCLGRGQRLPELGLETSKWVNRGPRVNVMEFPWSAKENAFLSQGSIDDVRIQKEWLTKGGGYRWQSPKSHSVIV